VCGDPRLNLVLNNRRSTMPVTYHIEYDSVAANGHQYFERTIRAGERNLLFPLWVNGRTWLRVYATPAGSTFNLAIVKMLYSGRIPAAQPWGTGQCPDTLAQQIRRARLH
jgi:hypothetical protein